MLSLLICIVLLILKAETLVADIGAVILTANSRNLTYVTTDPSVNYDGEAKYTYEDGEDMYFSCRKAYPEAIEYIEYLQLRSDPLRLEYYNAEGILLFQTKPRARRPHFFRSVLKSKNNKYYLDCIRTAGDSEREYRYRTTFYIMKKHDLYADGDHHAMILSVNGQKLTVITNNSNPASYYYDDYLYKYIDGEELNVTCRKTDTNMRGTLSFKNDDEAIARYISPMVRSPLEGYISLNVSAKNIHRKTLTFSINNSDLQKPNARLLFLSDLSENGIRIRGLPRENILYQYTNHLNKWTIEYQYSVDDTLNLTCVSTGSMFAENQRFQWEFNGETFISAALSSYSMVVFSNETFTKTLYATDNGKTINCVYIPHNSKTKERVIEIILRLKPEATNVETNSSTTLSNGNISAKSSSLILGSSLGAVFIILGLASVACWYVRTGNTRRHNETHYGDLAYQNNSPIPQYTNECENQNYACCSEIPAYTETYYEIPGNANKMNHEDHYTEIDVKVMKHKLVVPSLVYEVPSYQNNNNL